VLWHLPNTAGDASVGAAARIDSFDDESAEGTTGTLDSAWWGDRGRASIQPDVVASGTHALELTGDPQTEETAIVTLPAHIDTLDRDRRPAYPRAGDTVVYYVRSDLGSDTAENEECRSRFGIGVQDSGATTGAGSGVPFDSSHSTTLSIQINHHTDKWFLFEYRNGIRRTVDSDSTVLDGFPANTWFRIEVQWGHDGSLVAVAQAPDGTEKSRLTGSLTGSPDRPLVASGGVFVGMDASATDISVYVDAAVLTQRTTRPIEGFEAGDLSTWDQAESVWSARPEPSLPGPMFDSGLQADHPHYIRFDGSGTRTDYVFEVTDGETFDGSTTEPAIVKSDRNASINPGDEIAADGTRADGQVVGGADAYLFSGDIARLDVGPDGDSSLNGDTSSVTVEVNGQVVNQATTPSGMAETPPNTDRNRYGVVGADGSRGRLRDAPVGGTAPDFETYPRPGDEYRYQWRAGPDGTAPGTDPASAGVDGLNHQLQWGVQDGSESSRQYQVVHSLPNSALNIYLRPGDGTGSDFLGGTGFAPTAGDVYRTTVRWPLSADPAYRLATDIGPAPDAPDAFGLVIDRVAPNPIKRAATIDPADVDVDRTFTSGGVALYKGSSGRLEADGIELGSRRGGARVRHGLADFEGDSLSGWDRVDSAWDSRSEAAITGSYGLLGLDGEAGHIRSVPGDGLPPVAYPQAGDIYEFRWTAPFTDNDLLDVFAMVGVQSASENASHYEVHHEIFDNEIRLNRTDSDGTKTQLGTTACTISEGANYRTRLTWMPATLPDGTSDGRIGVELFTEATDGTIDGLAGAIRDPTPDTTWTSGGVGFQKDSTGAVHIDDLRVIGRTE
jgi:hypothetical protein